MAEKKRTTTARVWTLKECNRTLQEGRNNGFKVVVKSGITKIMDGDTMVVSWMVGMNGKEDLCLVRLDTRYFEGQGM